MDEKNKPKASSSSSEYFSHGASEVEREAQGIEKKMEVQKGTQLSLEKQKLKVEVERTQDASVPDTVEDISSDGQMDEEKKRIEEQSQGIEEGEEKPTSQGQKTREQEIEEEKSGDGKKQVTTDKQVKEAVRQKKAMTETGRGEITAEIG